jgi:hypothetical protein
MLPGWPIGRECSARCRGWLSAWSPYHRYVLAAERAMFEHPALRAVICNSPMVAIESEALLRRCRNMLPVIYNGVDTAVFHPAPWLMNSAK